MHEGREQGIGNRGSGGAEEQRGRGAIFCQFSVGWAIPSKFDRRALLRIIGIAHLNDLAIYC
jgi:hypothetical protein